MTLGKDSCYLKSLPLKAKPLFCLSRCKSSGPTMGESGKYKFRLKTKVKSTVSKELEVGPLLNSLSTSSRTKNYEFKISHCTYLLL